MQNILLKKSERAVYEERVGKKIPFPSPLLRTIQMIHDGRDLSGYREIFARSLKEKSMFAYELPLQPPCDEWKEYTLPALCKARIEDVCKDICKKGDRTSFQKFYDALYELIEADIEEENLSHYEE